MQAAKWIRRPVPKREIEKIRVHGWDSLSLDRTEIDLRYLEQIVDESQTAALGYTLQYILTRLADGKKKADQLAMEAAEKIQKEGILSVTPKNYGAGPSAEVRVQEILAALEDTVCCKCSVLLVLLRVMHMSLRLSESYSIDRHS